MFVIVFSHFSFRLDWWSCIPIKHMQKKEPKIMNKNKMHGLESENSKNRTYSKNTYLCCCGWQLSWPQMSQGESLLSSEKVWTAYSDSVRIQGTGIYIYIYTGGLTFHVPTDRISCQVGCAVGKRYILAIPLRCCISFTSKNQPFM